jgi:hypothetical protein
MGLNSPNNHPYNMLAHIGNDVVSRHRQVITWYLGRHIRELWQGGGYLYSKNSRKDYRLPTKGSAKGCSSECIRLKWCKSVSGSEMKRDLNILKRSNRKRPVITAR